MNILQTSGTIQFKRDYVVFRRLSILLSCLLVISGLLKLLSIENYSIALMQYGLHDKTALIAAKCVSLLEIILGTLVFIGVRPRVVGILVLVLTGISSVIALYDWSSDFFVSCGCYGGIDVFESSPMIRFVQYAMMSFLAILLSSKNIISPLPWSKSRWVFALIGTIALAIGVFAFNRSKELEIIKEQPLKIHYLPKTLLNTIESSFISKNTFIFQLNVSDKSPKTKPIMLKDKINSSHYSIVLLFTPFDCLSCFHSVGETSDNFVRKTNETVQMMGIGIRGESVDIIEFAQQASLEFSIYALHSESQDIIIKTPALLLVSKKDGILLGFKLEPSHSAKEGIFLEIERAINPVNAGKTGQ